MEPGYQLLVFSQEALRAFGLPPTGEVSIGRAGLFEAAKRGTVFLVKTSTHCCFTPVRDGRATRTFSTVLDGVERCSVAWNA